MARSLSSFHSHISLRQDPGVGHPECCPCTSPCWRRRWKTDTIVQPPAPVPTAGVATKDVSTPAHALFAPGPEALKNWCRPIRSQTWTGAASWIDLLKQHSPLKSCTPSTSPELDIPSKNIHAAVMIHSKDELFTCQQHSGKFPLVHTRQLWL